jgi:phage-related protein
MASVISVLAKVSADASGFVGGMRNAETAAKKLETAVNSASSKSAGDFDKSTKQMGDSAIRLGGILATAAKGFLLFQGVNFMKGAVKSASAFEAEFEGVNQAFLDGASVVQEFAKQAAFTAGVGEVPALRAAKGFGVFASSAGLAGEEAGKFATGLVQAAGDLGSFYDLPTEQALAAISSGLRGETEPLRRFNILIGEAEMSAKAMAMGLGANSAALTQQQKVLVRQQLILEGVGVAQGDFVKYSDTYGNAIKTLGALMQNLSKDVGGALLPVLAELALSLVPIIQQLTPLLTKVFEALIPVVEAITNNLGNITPILEPIINTLAIVAQSFAQIIDAVLPSLIEIITMLAPHLESLGELFAVIIEKALPPLVKLLEALMPVLKMFSDEIGTYVIPILTFLANVIGDVLGFAVEKFAGFLTFLFDIIRPLKEAIYPLIDAFLTFFGIKPNHQLDQTSVATANLAANVAAADRAKLGNLKNEIMDVKSSANEAFNEIRRMRTYAGVPDVAVAEVSPVVTTAINSALGNSSTAQAATQVANNLLTKEERNFDARKAALESFAQSVEQIFKGIKESILGSFDLPSLGNSVSSITRNIKKLLDKTKSFATNIKSLAASGLNDTLLRQVIAQGPVAGARLAEALASGGAGFIQEINSSYGQFGDLATDIATSGTNAAFSGAETVNNYNISVNGGVGSGPTIGRAIVEAIKAYERTSGAVWQST